MDLSRRAWIAKTSAAAATVAVGLAKPPAAPAAAAAAGGPGDAGPFTLPPLPYPAAALAPHIDARTMEIHHGKHHAAYVAKLNAALAEAPALRERPLAQLLGDLGAAPEAVRTAIRNNGGGHANHSLFWKIMGPGKGGEPAGKLGQAIAATFGGFAKFRETFTAAALGVFGSGWAWLVADGDRLLVASTPNQDSPLMTGQTPLLGLDVWEHAYYLNYQNRRADYVAAFFNVIDWDGVAANLPVV